MVNDNFGISASYSSNTIVSENNISDNYNYGILLSISYNNSIYHNRFVDNGEQSFSWNSQNFWDNGTKGNYWSDYRNKYPKATEIDGTGIRGTSYDVDKINQDNYPMVPEFSQVLILTLFMKRQCP